MKRQISQIRKKNIPNFIIILLFSMNVILLNQEFSSSAQPTNNGIVLQSKWTWDEPFIDGNLDQLWSACPSYSFSISNYRDPGNNQTFWLKFLNNGDFLFILIDWNDDYIHGSDRITFYFDQNNNGNLDNSSEDAKAVSGLLPSLNDYFWDGNDWILDTNQSMESGGALQTDQLELKIPIGVHAEDEDLNLISPGDIVGFGLVAIDGESEDGYTGTWPSEIYGPANDSSNWADLQLAALPELDFPVILTPSSSIIHVGEVFYVLGFVSNNNGTSRVYNLYATLTLPNETELAPVTSLFQIIDDLTVGQNHTFMWPLIAKNAGTFTIELLVDGMGIPTLTKNLTITVFAPFPEIYLITPQYGESILELTLFQFSIHYQGTLIRADFSLDSQESWSDLTYNPITTYYEALIDNRTLTSHLYIRAVDNGNRVTILDLQIFNQVISSANVTQTQTIGDSPPDISLIDYCKIDDVIKVNLQVYSQAIITDVDYLLPDGTWLPTSFLMGIYSFQFQISTITNGSIIRIRAIDEFLRDSYLLLTVNFVENMPIKEITIIIQVMPPVTPITSTTSLASTTTTTTTTPTTKVTTQIMSSTTSSDGKSGGFIKGWEVWSTILGIIGIILVLRRNH